MMARSWTVELGNFPSWMVPVAAVLEPNWWLISWPTSVKLTRGPLDLAQSIEGRAFGESGELRWRLDENSILAVAVAVDVSILPLGGEAPDLTLTDPAKASIQLWGRWEDGRWQEGRFRQPLLYDLSGGRQGDRVRVSVERFTDETGGPPIERFVDVTVEGHHA